MPEPSVAQGALIAQRYRVERTLGRSRHATTYLAADERAGRQVVIKHFALAEALRGGSHGVTSLDGPEAFKLRELFEREARVLRHLGHHPAIPDFYDYFVGGVGGRLELYLVQEYVPGKNLFELVRSGRHFSEREVVELGIAVARTLEYLHELSPPIIHRDLKPSNVILDDNGAVYLIDFGAVKDRIVQSEVEAATIVGTFGYMPLEQFEGRAVAASDVYALAATLVFALSHREPAQIARRGGRLDYHGHVKVSRDFARVLDRALDPDPTARYAGGRELREALETLLTTARRPSPWVIGGLVCAVGLGLWVASQPGDRPEKTATLRTVAPAGSFAVRKKPTGVFEPLEGFASEAMELSADAAGSVIATTKYEVMRFPDEHIASAINELGDRGGLRAAMGTDNIEAMHSSLAVGATEFWLGSWHGKLVHRQGGQWSRVAVPQTCEKGAIGGFERFASDLYVVCAGWLWQRTSAGEWRRALLPRTTHRVRTLADGKLYADGGSALFRLEGETWQRFWSAGGPSAEIEDFAAMGDGTLVVATTDGYRTVDAAGTLIGTGLAGIHLRAVAPHGPGRFWLGSWGDGLYYVENGATYRHGFANGLPDDDIIALLIDRHGRLWVGMYGGGMAVADAARAASAVKAQTPSEQGPGVVYTDPLAAADRELPAGSSGGVAVAGWGGERFVFFDGVAVFPPFRSSHQVRAARRADGGLAFLRPDWSGEIIAASGTRAIEAPATPPAEPPRGILLDAAGHVWAGTNRLGVFQFNGTVWRAVGADARVTGATVWTLAADEAGAIWMGLFSEADRVSGKHAIPNLARLARGAWSYFSPDQGLASWSTQAILPLPDGRVAVGTNGGLSLIDGDRITTYDGSEIGQGFVAAVSRDPEGLLWINHLYWGRGVTIFDGRGFTSVDSRRGLFADKIAATAHAGGGRVWLIADDGRTGIYPRDALLAAAEPVTAR